MKPYYEQDGITIYHGDCRDVLPLIGGTFDIVTDPPYGVGIDYGPSYDDSPKVYWEWFVPVVQTMKENARTLAFTHRVRAMQHLTDWDWIGVWSKPGAFGSRVGNSSVLPHWEPVFLYGIHGAGTKSTYRSDVLEFNPQKVSGLSSSFIGREKWEKGGQSSHPTPKPLALFSELIRWVSQDDATIVDCFMGSGTTLRAAKDLGRKSIGIEIEERYCEIAANRLAQGVLFGVKQ